MLKYILEIINEERVTTNLLIGLLSKEEAKAVAQNYTKDMDWVRIKQIHTVSSASIIFLDRSYFCKSEFEKQVFQYDFYLMFYRYTTYWFGESVWLGDAIALANKTMLDLANALMDNIIKGIAHNKQTIKHYLFKILHDRLRDDCLKLKDSSGRIKIPNEYIDDIYHLLEIFKLADEIEIYNCSFCKARTMRAKNISDITDDLNRRITRDGDKDDVESTELCTILNISKTALSGWIKNGIITTYNKKGNQYLYKLSDVLKDLKRR